MTNTTTSVIQQNKSNNGTINGISIASFLQMLEQEKHSCRVQVQSGSRIGLLYFKDGDLIDAKYEQSIGIDAAYTIISWENSSIGLLDAVSRTRQINQQLGYILLNAAKQQDEEQLKTVTNKPTITYVSSEVEQNSDYQNTINVLTTIDTIRYFYLLNKTGNIIAHSAPDQSLDELLIYCIITSNNLRKSLHTRSPQRIHMHMKDGSSLFILPKAGKILALLLDAQSSVAEIVNQITKGLSVK